MVYRLLICLQYYAVILIVTPITRYLDLKTVRAVPCAVCASSVLVLTAARVPSPCFTYPHMCAPAGLGGRLLGPGGPAGVQLPEFAVSLSSAKCHRVRVLLAARGLPVSAIMAISEYSLLPNFCNCEGVRVESHLVVLICLTTSEGISRTSLVLCASGSVSCLFIVCPALSFPVSFVVTDVCKFLAIWKSITLL